MDHLRSEEDTLEFMRSLSMDPRQSEEDRLEFLSRLSELKTASTIFKSSLGRKDCKAERAAGNQEKDDEKAKGDKARFVVFLEGMRMVGNNFFRKENWFAAQAIYTACLVEAANIGKILNCRSEEFYNVLKLTHSNRAEALLRLSSFEGASADAEYALKIDPTHVKSLSRLGRAKMGLGAYEKACELFEAVLEQGSDDPAVREHLKVCRNRLGRSHAGKEDEDFMECDDHGRDSMYGREAEPGAEHADQVEILRVGYGDGRRGLFAKNQISAHETFIVSNTLAVTRNHEGNSSKDASSQGGDHDRLVQVLRKAMKSKWKLAQLSSLASAGKGEMEIPPIKLLNSHLDGALLATWKLTDDVDRVKGTVKMKSFASDQETVELIPPTSGFLGLSSRPGRMNLLLWEAVTVFHKPFVHAKLPSNVEWKCEDY